MSAQNQFPGQAGFSERWQERLETAIDGILGPIRRAPGRQGGDALYTLPWFLFCGTDSADPARLLSTLADSAPVAIQNRSDGTDALWEWRFFGDAVGAAIAPAVVEGTNSRADQAWLAMLGLLARKRPLLPLNGIVLTVAAASLKAPCRELALRLRALTDGAMQALDLVVPVYLVVTGLEALPGLSSFGRALPAACCGQAMGHRFPERPMSGAEAGKAFADAIDGVEARSQELMLALLRDAEEEAARGIFSFVHALRGINHELRAFTSNLVADSALQRRPLWRGLYYTGAAPEPLFLSDLSKRLLPVDQPLARRA